MSEPGGRSSRSHRSGCPVTGCAAPFIQPSSIALSLATEPETDMPLWEAGDTSADSAVVSQYRCCNSDTFRVSKMDSKQIEKVSLFYISVDVDATSLSTLAGSIVGSAAPPALIAAASEAA